MALSAEKKVGIVFFLGVAILIVFTVIISDVSFFKRQYRISILFDSVGGLERGDKVAMSGMDVGDVKQLIQDGPRVKVVIAINKDIKVPRDSVIKISDEGLLGGKRLDIAWGDAAGGFIQAGEEVTGVSPPGLSQVIANLGESSKKIDQILSSTREITEKISRGEGTVGKLINDESIFDNARDISEKISSGTGTLGKLINESEIYDDIKKIMAELQKAVEENRKDIRQLVKTLKEAAPRVKKTMGNLEEISEKINKGEGTLGKLVNDQAAYDDARQTMASVKTAGDKLTDIVSRAERIQFYIGGETMYNVDTERFLSKAYVQIEPTPSKVYMVGVSLLTGPGTEAEYTDDPDVEVDAQIGLRFIDDRLTLRAGMLEGRFGGGVDFRIWEKKLIATVEGRSVWTKEKDEGIDPFLLRARLTMDLIWGFYVHAGGDNLLDKAAVNVGAGLRIRDDDIKALFGVAGLAQ